MRISANTPDHEISIPFEGLALRWESNMRLYYENQLQLQRNDTTIYLYSERNPPSVFKREEISPQIVEDTVDIVTREVLSGPLIGTITSHCFYIRKTLLRAKSRSYNIFLKRPNDIFGRIWLSFCLCGKKNVEYLE